MKRLRAVVLGGSHWHAPLYVPGWLRSHDIVSISDPDPAAAAELAAALNAPVVDDHQKALFHSGLDVAYVFAPHHQMAAVAGDVIDRGIPLVLEKPGGIEAGQVAGLRRSSERAGVPVAVPLVQRLGPLPAVLGRAGRLSYFSAQFIAGPPERYRRSASAWMLDPQQSGGGCVINLAPHFVDLFTLLTGERPQLTYAARDHHLHGSTVEDHGLLVLATPSGARCVIEVGYAFPDSPAKRHVSFTTAGRDGYVSIDASGTVRANEGTTVDVDHVEVDSDPLYARFVDEVAGRHNDAFSGLPGLAELEHVMTIIDGTRQIFP